LERYHDQRNSGLEQGDAAEAFILNASVLFKNELFMVNNKPLPESNNVKAAPSPILRWRLFR